MNYQLIKQILKIINNYKNQFLLTDKKATLCNKF